MPDTRMVLVPREATGEIQEAILLAGKEGHYARDKWAAMIAAAPNAGKVTRERLREALDAVDTEGRGKLFCERMDILAAALGLEIVEG